MFIYENKETNRCPTKDTAFKRKIITQKWEVRTKWAELRKGMEENQEN